MKKVGFWLFLAIMAALLCGCRAPMRESSSGKIVDSIVITAEETDQFTRRFYNVDEKMQLILLYLRSLGPKFQAKEDPHSQVGPMICITMYYSDGSQRIFRQKGPQYFQEGTGLWQTIDPEKGAALWRIVLHTPSDPEPDPLRHTALPRIDGNWQDPGSIWRIHKQNTRAYCPGAVSSASKAWDLGFPMT